MPIFAFALIVFSGCIQPPVCGNGICDAGESPTSCPQDCATKCVEEGDKGTAGSDSCCSGLSQIDLCTVEPMACACSSDPFVCSFCGDGSCGLGENSCNCAGDCPPQQSTLVEIGPDNLYYEDATNGIRHTVPFYLNAGDLSDGQSVTFVLDTKTFYLKVNIVDKNVTIRQDNATGPIIADLSYVDKVVGETVKLPGASDVEANYKLFVNEVSLGAVARVWLFIEQQRFLSKLGSVDFYGTDTLEKRAVNVFYFEPNSIDLPSELGGGSAFNVNNLKLAYFSVVEPNNGGVAVAVIDTQTKKLLSLPNAELSNYFFEGYFFGPGAVEYLSRYNYPPGVLPDYPNGTSFPSTFTTPSGLNIRLEPDTFKVEMFSNP